MERWLTCCRNREQSLSKQLDLHPSILWAENVSLWRQPTICHYDNTQWRSSTLPAWDFRSYRGVKTAVLFHLKKLVGAVEPRHYIYEDSSPRIVGGAYRYQRSYLVCWCINLWIKKVKKVSCFLKSKWDIWWKVPNESTM